MSSINIKVVGGTARSDEASLCHSCKHAHIVRGMRHTDELIECAELYRGGQEQLKRFEKVSSCNRYINTQHPSLRVMENMAWIIRTDGVTKKIGFVPMKDIPQEQREYRFGDYEDY